MQKQLIALVVVAILALGLTSYVALVVSSRLSDVAEDLSTLNNRVLNVSREVGALRESLAMVNSTLSKELGSLEERVNKLNKTVERLVRPKPEIVVVPIDMPIFNFFTNELIQYLEMLDSDNSTIGVILLIDSPGGSVGATERLYNAVRGLNKTVYAVINGLGASGAYYVSLASKRIYASSSSLVGSVGVIAFIDPDEFSVDLPEFVFTTGPYKWYGMGFLDWLAAVEGIKENFLAVVAENREGRLRIPLSEVGEARLYLGSEAYEKGLVDEVGGLWDAVRDLARELGVTEYTVIDVYKKFNATRRGFLPFVIDYSTAYRESGVWRALYLYPGAISMTGPELVKTGYANVSRAARLSRYVVLDMAHNNYVTKSFLDSLVSYLARYNVSLVVATSGEELTSLIKNATGLVITTPLRGVSNEEAMAILEEVSNGMRLLVLYEPRATSLFFARNRLGPLALQPVLSAYNISIIDRAMYNASGPGIWHQFVVARVSVNDTILDGVERLVFFSPAPIIGGEVVLKASGVVQGLDVSEASVLVRVGNVVVIGSQRSLSSFFIELGDNARLLDNIARFLSSRGDDQTTP